MLCPPAQEVSKSVYFMKQTVGNACGTVGILHSIANNLDRVDLSEDSPCTHTHTSWWSASGCEKLLAITA